MKLETALSRRLGLRYPFVSAPMFLISNKEMLLAGAQAGILACMPSLNARTNEQLRADLSWIRARTDKPIGINLTLGLTPPERIEADLAACLEFDVPVILTSYGNPAEIVKRAHEKNRLVFHDVITLAHGKKAVSVGVDAIIAVAAGAGGHAGRISPFVLVPWLAEELKVPIIAAGCISDGRQVVASLSLGAQLCYLGTRFIASTECGAVRRVQAAGGHRRPGGRGVHGRGVRHSRQLPQGHRAGELLRRPLSRGRQAVEGHLERGPGRRPHPRGQADGRDRRRPRARGPRHVPGAVMRALLVVLVFSGCVKSIPGGKAMEDNPIVQVGAPVLRSPAQDVPPERIPTPEFQALLTRMVATMRAAPGVGLAAPQIGVPWRVLVLEDREELMASLTPAERAERERVPVPVRVFINPTLTPVGEDKVTFFEGCLSVAGFAGLVERFHEVEVTGLDEQGQPQTWRVTGWPARILQHEVDHLGGTLYIDRMITRSFGTLPQVKARFGGRPIADIKQELGVNK